MDDPIKTIQRQTQRYWYVDGLTEIGAGVLIFLLGLLYLLVGLLSPGALADWLIGFGQPGLIVAGWLIVNWVVRGLKERITYPRTGYVAYRRERGGKRTRAILVTVGLAAGFAIAAVYFGKLAGERMIPVLIGLMMAGAVAYLGYTFSLRRFYLLAAVCVVLGGAGTLFQLGDNFSMALFFGGFGIAWVVSGAVTLSAYLHSTQPALGEEV